MLGPEGQRKGADVQGVKVVGGSVVVEQFCEEGKGLLMEGFVSKKNFELNPLLNRKPIVVVGTSEG